MSELTNAERFIDAFNRIERILRSRASEKARRLTFPELVNESKSVTTPEKTKLRDMGVLRNAIVHNPRDVDGELIADPRLSAVEWLENRADLIENPPTVFGSLRMSSPKVLTEDDGIEAFLTEVGLPLNYSQSPVRLDKGEFGLVTTNSLARWVAANYDPNDGLLLEKSKISEIIPFGEEGDRVVVKSRNFKVVDAIRLFSGENGVAPGAILLTQDGKSDQTPIGLCVEADIPALYRALGL